MAEEKKVKRGFSRLAEVERELQAKRKTSAEYVPGKEASEINSE